MARSRLQLSSSSDASSQTAGAGSVSEVSGDSKDNDQTQMLSSASTSIESSLPAAQNQDQQAFFGFMQHLIYKLQQQRQIIQHQQRIIQQQLLDFQQYLQQYQAETYTQIQGFRLESQSTISNLQTRLHLRHTQLEQQTQELEILRAQRQHQARYIQTLESQLRTRETQIQALRQRSQVADLRNRFAQFSLFASPTPAAPRSPAPTCVPPSDVFLRPFKQ